MDDSKQLWRASISALFAVVLWGLAFPLIQIGLETFNPIMLGFLRFVLASALLMAVVLVRHSLDVIHAVAKREWKPLIALGLLYVTVPNIAQNMGLESGTSSIASVIQSSGPVMTLLFAVILLRESLTRMKAIGTVVAMAGTVLLVASGGLSLNDADLASNLLILLSAASYGLGWVSAKRMLERNPPMVVIGLSIAIGTIFLGLATPLEGNSSSGVTMDSLVILGVLGFLCAGVASVLYLRAIERQEVSRMAFLIYLMPVFASAFAWVLRGEKVESWTAVCGFIIVIGIVIANRGSLSNWAGMRKRTMV